MRIFLCIVTLFTVVSCGDLDPRKLAREYCDCAHNHDADGPDAWKCDTLAKQNARKMNNNEEAQRAYNVTLRECMNAK